MSKPFKPTKAQLLAAVNKTVPDTIAPDLKVLFVGINPGLYSAATHRHFARPGNRFWPALFAGGFTDRVLSPLRTKHCWNWVTASPTCVAERPTPPMS
jgi:TDG/mug DNA glycosylase family protein